MHIQNPRRVIRRRPGFSLGGLGAWGEKIPADAVYWNTYPTVVPPSGFKEKIVPPAMGGSAYDQLVPKTVTVQNNDRGGGTFARPNPHYAAPGAALSDTILQQFKNGAMKVTLPPMASDTEEAWRAARATIPVFSTYIVGAQPGTWNQGGVSGASSGKVYVTDPQAWLNLQTSNQYGFAKKWIGKKDWMDYISDGIAALVQAIVISGITAGIASGFGMGPLATGSNPGAIDAAKTGASAAQDAASAAASDAGTLYAPASNVATSAVSTSTSSLASEALKSAATYVKTAKDILGVASVIKAVASGKPVASAPAASLDSSYSGGSGSGGGAGGSGSAPSLLTQLTSGNMPLYIGGGVLAFIAFTLLATRNSAPRARRRRS